jgi:hypothetical protein
MLAAAAAVSGCVRGSEEFEDGQLSFFVVLSNGIYAVDSFGAQTKFDFIRDAQVENAPFLDAFADKTFLHFLTLSAAELPSLTQIRMEGEELWLYSLLAPTRKGILKARLGWAGRRLYLLTDTGEGGVRIEHVIWPAVGDSNAFPTEGEWLLTPALDNLGPGLEDPVSFDLKTGGNQAYVLYESGKVVTYNLYIKEPAGLVAEFPAGARDIHVMMDGAIFVCGDKGLFAWVPGAEPFQITDLGPISLCRVEDQTTDRILVGLQTGELYEVWREKEATKFFLQVQEPARALIPLGETWVKPTQPLPGWINTTGVYLTGISNSYELHVLHPDALFADVSLTLTSSPDHGAYFTFQGFYYGEWIDCYGQRTCSFPPTQEQDWIPVYFYGGTAPAQVTVTLEALADNGQSSRWDIIFDVQAPPPG